MVMTPPGPGDESNLNHASQLITISAMVFLGLCIVVHCCYIVFVDLPAQRIVLTSTNVHLFLMAISLIGLHASLYSVINSEYLSARYINSSTGQVICTTMFEIFAIRYSWDRSGSVVKRLLPKTAKFLQVLVVWIPLLGLLEIVPSILYSALHDRGINPTISNVLFILSTAIPLVFASLSLVFDAALLTAFCTYTRGIHETLESSRDQFFEMIARYGIASIVFYAGSIGFYGLGQAFRLSNFFIFLAVSYFMLIFSYISLLLMKLGNVRTYRSSGSKGSVKGATG
ncbi:hypothetical protein HDU80_004996 [Chytriomyces hyalinus]|nr:hypothetical protein HDU80_004996 [Chytriomyces hyalinus]